MGECNGNKTKRPGTEVPWVSRPPTKIVHTNVRPSLQPLDAPPTAESLDRLMGYMQPDELLLLPAYLSTDLVRWIMVDNRRATYARLLEPAR